MFFALQLASAVAGVLGTGVALILGHVGVAWLSIALGDRAVRPALASVVGFAALIAVSLLCYRVLFTFFRMCGRLKRETAFTAQNEQAMRRIAWDFAFCAGILAAAVIAIYIFTGESMPPLFFVAMISFLFAFAALLACALGRLVRRANELEQENNLTI